MKNWHLWWNSNFLRKWRIEKIIPLSFSESELVRTRDFGRNRSDLPLVKRGFSSRLSIPIQKILSGIFEITYSKWYHNLEDHVSNSQFRVEYLESILQNRGGLFHWDESFDHWSIPGEMHGFFGCTSKNIKLDFIIAWSFKL